MIRSMTGYSSVRAEESGFALSVSVKTTNHRNLDLQFRVSPSLESLEVLLRRWVKDFVLRGHVEVTVTLDKVGGAGIQIDRRLLDGYLAAFRELRKEFDATSEPDLLALLRVPGMVAAGDGELSVEGLEQTRRLWSEWWEKL